MIVTLLTDFGTADHYVAAMKGVILSLQPGTTIVDISHEVPPQDVHTAAYLLAACSNEFPSGTVHLVVVDPGVGSPRLPLVSRADDHLFVGPDNGVFSFVWASSRSVEVRRIERTVPGVRGGGSTFHGRDLFAPVAAALAGGLVFESVGHHLPDPFRFPSPQPLTDAEGALVGEIIHIDRFGNCITNLPSSALPTEPERAVRLIVGSAVVDRLEVFYAAAEEAKPFVIRGSLGYLEVSVRNDSAARLLGVSRGTKVIAPPAGSANLPDATREGTLG